MNPNKTVNLVNQDGTIVSAEVILYFRLEKTNKDYVIYTKNEKDEKGLISIYASVLSNINNEYFLENIDSDDEWNQIKDIMKKIVSENVVTNE